MPTWLFFLFGLCNRGPGLHSSMAGRTMKNLHVPASCNKGVELANFIHSFSQQVLMEPLPRARHSHRAVDTGATVLSSRRALQSTGSQPGAL